MESVAVRCPLCPPVLLQLALGLPDPEGVQQDAGPARFAPAGHELPARPSLPELARTQRDCPFLSVVHQDLQEGC